MSLREEAAADAKVFLEDTAGFGWPITVTNPDGVVASLRGFANDISHTIDPDTGQAVTGRMASVALSIQSLADAGLGLPRNVADKAEKPWVVRFEDVNGNLHTFKVQEALPDRAAGVVVCLLETYEL